MDLILAGLQWTSCLVVYLDDIIIFVNNVSNHLQNLQLVFDRIQDAGLKLKPTKCVFLKEEVKYLGHIVSNQGVSADPDKLLKVQTWPVPQSTKDVQQFLGLANYYRRFIHNFARIAKPLHKLTECTTTVSWSQECQQSFEALRDRLSSPLILSYPDFTTPFILDTDASNDAIGALLSQCDEQGEEHVIAYASHLLSKAERNYCVTRKELLAFISYFRTYLLGQQFTLCTDLECRCSLSTTMQAVWMYSANKSMNAPFVPYILQITTMRKYDKQLSDPNLAIFKQPKTRYPLSTMRIKVLEELHGGIW